MASEANKRIAKNTIFLYIRQLVVMGVSLFTFRLILKLLGVDDYGTYSVIGGVIVLFSFLNSAMTQSTQRYLSFALGKGDTEGLKRIFSMSVNVYFILCLVIIALAETVGLWFLHTYMKFPTASRETVNIVYQFTILTTLAQVLQLPFKSAIIAHERMKFFAYLSILEVALKLAVVGILFLLPSNRLVGYAISLFVIAVILSGIYWRYCSAHFSACRYHPFWNRSLFHELTSYSGWNLLGSISNVGAQQGLNILFNIFAGVAVNAAMGVTNQVSGALNSFVASFQTAFNPQIIKLYASGEKEKFFTLIFRASRLSFVLLFVLGLPVIVCCRPILNLWLTEVPEYSVPFIQLMLIFSLIDALSGPLWVSAQATGKIRNYMLLMFGLIFSNVPIAWLMLRFGFSPVLVIASKVMINLLTQIVRILYLKQLLDLPVQEYFKSVMMPTAIAFVVAAPLPWILQYREEGIIWSASIFAFTLLSAVLASWFIILQGNERKVIEEKAKSVLQKFH